MRYSNNHSFYFDSDLTDEEKNDIIEWCRSMTPKQEKMLNQIIEDVLYEHDYILSEE